jgi:hypothetical protein
MTSRNTNHYTTEDVMIDEGYLFNNIYILLFKIATDAVKLLSCENPASCEQHFADSRYFITLPKYSDLGLMTWSTHAMDLEFMYPSDVRQGFHDDHITDSMSDHKHLCYQTLICRSPAALRPI